MSISKVEIIIATDKHFAMLSVAAEKLGLSLESYILSSAVLHTMQNEALRDMVRKP